MNASIQDDQEQQWCQAVHDALDVSAEQLDGATVSRLTQARHRALAQRRRRSRLLLPLGLTGATSAAVLAVALWTLQPLAPEPSALEDFDIIAGNVELEFYQDLDFYEWLDGHAG